MSLPDYPNMPSLGINTILSRVFGYLVFDRLSPFPFQAKVRSIKLLSDGCTA
jgi:hypothetical protein